MDIIQNTGYLSGYMYDNPITGLPALTHCGEAYCSTDHFVDLHTHPAFEFVYMVAGTAFWQVADTMYEQHPCELFWTLPGEPHKFARTFPAPFHFLWFGFHLDAMDQGGQRAAEALRGLFRQGRRVMPDAREMEAVIRGIILQSISQRPGCTEVCRDYLHALASLLTQFAAPEGLPAATDITCLASFPLQRAVHFMMSNLNRHVPLAEMAAFSCMSVTRFCCHFRRSLKVPPAVYHLRMRLEAARDVLLQPEMSVTQVAMEFGFSSSQHFSACFHRLFGITPQEWKRGLNDRARRSNESA